MCFNFQNPALWQVLTDRESLLEYIYFKCCNDFGHGCHGNWLLDDISPGPKLQFQIPY